MAVLLAGLLAAACSSNRVPQPRGLILISLDTLRADRLGLYGYDRETTPFLDSLGERALVFERALSQAPWTAPAHATMLTSMYPSVLGLGAYPRAGVIPESAISLAEQLRGAGFRTRAETAGGFLSARLGFSQGFEQYEDRPQSFGASIDRGLAWLSQLGPGERFFLFLHTYDIHRYAPPAAARSELVERRRPPAALARARSEAMRLGAHGLAELVQNPVHRTLVERLDGDSRLYLSQLYDASIRAADAQIARLCEALAATGMLDETLLVVTSDHGEELFDHGRTGHGFTLYDENLRVPLLMLHPGLAPARVAEAVSLLDLAPTLSALLGVPAADTWQGGVVASWSKRRIEARPVFAEAAHRPLHAVREGHFKLIRDRQGRAQLFDLQSDPGEQRDLASSGTEQERELEAALDGWQRESALRRLPSSSGSADLGDALIDQLEALGYMDVEPADPPQR